MGNAGGKFDTKSEVRPAQGDGEADTAFEDPNETWNVATLDGRILPE
jgi:hypothetical protein